MGKPGVTYRQIKHAMRISRALDTNNDYIPDGGGGGGGPVLFSKLSLNAAVLDGDVKFVGDPVEAHTQTASTITDFSAAVATAMVVALAAKQATLISGTNLKTINGNSLLGSGNIVIAGEGGSSVSDLSYTASTGVVANSNGTGFTVPLATTSVRGLMSNTDKLKLDGVATSATANQPDATLKDRANHTGSQTSSTISDFTSSVNALITGKQDTLVSATNIKTINGSTILGSGNLVVSGGASANPFAWVPASGDYRGNNNSGTSALTSAATVASRLYLGPFVTNVNLAIDQAGVSVATAGAGSTVGKVVVYSAHASTGWPDTLLAQSANVAVDAVATVLGAFGSTLNLTAGTLYWIGFVSTGTPSIRVLASSDTTPLSWNNAGTPTANKTLFKNITYGSPDATWTYSGSQHSVSAVPFVMMRIA